MKKFVALLTGLILTLALALGTAHADAVPVPVILSDDGIQCEDPGVTVDGSSVTFAAPGKYEITGSLSNGQLVVNCEAEGTLSLILNNVSVHNETGAAIHIRQCTSRAYIVLADGSSNALSAGTDYALDADDEPNGVLFSKDDFTIEGSGALTVTAPYMDGIVSKDDVCINGGTIAISAERNGIRGKDSVEITGGTIDIIAGNDGIKSTNEKEAAKGFITISGGTIHIQCADDPISAITRLTIGAGVTIDVQITAIG